MNKYYSAVMLIAVCILFNGCKKPAPDTSAAINVAVSIFPIYDIARNICGDRARVFYAIPAGADPHTFEPQPSIAKELQRTTIFIGVAEEFDGWMEKFLPDRCVKKYIMKRPIDETISANPHFWLSVRHAKKIAMSVAMYCSEIDPDHRASYQTNLADYMKKLNELDRNIAILFLHKKNKAFIQWHEAWNYFAADNGLTIAGTVNREGSDKASVRSIKEIVDRAKKDSVSVIVVSLNAEQKAAEMLAVEIQGTIVQMDSLGNPEVKDRSDYLKLMLYNATVLSQALR